MKDEQIEEERRSEYDISQSIRRVSPLIEKHFKEKSVMSVTYIARGTFCVTAVGTFFSPVRR